MKLPEIKKKCLCKECGFRRYGQNVPVCQKGRRKKKWNDFCQLDEVLLLACWKQRQHHGLQITVTSHAGFRRRSKHGGVCFLSDAALQDAESAPAVRPTPSDVTFNCVAAISRNALCSLKKKKKYTKHHNWINNMLGALTWLRGVKFYGNSGEKQTVCVDGSAAVFWGNKGQHFLLLFFF